MVGYSELVQFLRLHHYNEVPEIRQSGDFVVRGDTISCWLASSPLAHRVHFFGEDVEKIEIASGTGWLPVKSLPELVANELKTEHGTVVPGDYIVHPHHGVGIFERIETRSDGDKIVRRFIALQYAAEDRLLFPWERNGELMPYIGSRQPRLTRLNSKAWQRTKEKVQNDLIAIARELLKTYAARQLSTRTPYSGGDEWVQVLAQEVAFDLTEDQERALQDIDTELMKSEHPMDRLICGDVGFGKTEIALRTAARVLASGRQVAIVAPTTVLVEQHYEVLKQRFASLPVTVSHLSRLNSGQQKPVVEGLADGTIDCIVGTHRILSKDIVFRDLGLLIVDEEQKFGVAQKELLKEIRPSLDVLSLSATPIPRTLSMSLSGLRGLSILRTPPKGRLPVQTHILAYTDFSLRDALAQALNTGGQAYVVHNRVQSLPTVRERIIEILTTAGRSVYIFDPKSQIAPLEGQVVLALAHGQMDEVLLAQTMAAFMAGSIHILLASSIVEHGLDSPSATVLAVLHSERFGLSDLYQLRGRVGRRQQQAYAYFFIGGVGEEGAVWTSEDIRERITATARKRMKALQEADELGSGWSIALRDLEIRGGGNVLGNEQHGNMEAIGLLLYAQLLQEEIGRQAHKLGIRIVQKN